MSGDAAVKIIGDIIRDVAELEPSPSADESRDSMLVTASELRAILEKHLPVTSAASDENHMWKIADLIASLSTVLERYGNTCVYIRRGGMGWGAVALNREADDKKNGVFDLQAQHDRAMSERLGQVERLLAAKREAEDQNRRLRDLVQCLIDNEPDDAAADGVSVLDVWRKNASAMLV